MGSAHFLNNSFPRNIFIKNVVWKNVILLKHKVLFEIHISYQIFHTLFWKFWSDFFYSCEIISSKSLFQGNFSSKSFYANMFLSWNASRKWYIFLEFSIINIKTFCRKFYIVCHLLENRYSRKVLIKNLWSKISYGKIIPSSNSIWKSLFLRKRSIVFKKILIEHFLLLQINFLGKGFIRKKKSLKNFW